MNIKKAVYNIRQELKKYIIDNKLKSLVLGISGGIDSTLCALLAKPICIELDIELIGRSLPIVSNSINEIKRAKEVGEMCCTDFKEINLESVYVKLCHLSEDDGVFDTHKLHLIRKGNIKARIRMIYLYDLAQIHNGMGLSTDNYTEWLLGFFTLHGDVFDYGMIQNLWKTEVYEMTEWIINNEINDDYDQQIILDIVNADATDGLGITKTDLDQIMPGWEGSSIDGYKIVDNKLYNYITFFEGKKDPVVLRHLKTKFKRNNPYNISRDKIIF